MGNRNSEHNLKQTSGDFRSNVNRSTVLMQLYLYHTALLTVRLEANGTTAAALQGLPLVPGADDASPCVRKCARVCVSS